MSGDCIVRALEDIFSLPADKHWFCPRDASDQSGTYFDEDVLDTLTSETDDAKKARHARLELVRQTRHTVIQASQIFAYDGTEALDYKERLEAALAKQLTGCSICVREFHRFRTELRHELDGEYESEQVHVFMQRYDHINLTRITGRLDSAKATLLETPPEDRKIAALSSEEIFALFESMHCTPLLQDESLLESHFDQPFRLVQTKAKISLPEYSPALTAFLFSFNNDRLQWALRGWKKIKRNITGTEFDWTVRDNLVAAAGRVNIQALEKEFMPTYWRGMHVIVQRLDQELVTHHLRAMDVNVCRLALDHMQVDSECFVDLLGTLRCLLEIAPADTWDSFGTIPPQTVVEQIFNSPSFERLLFQDSSANLESALTWIEPLLRSIKPASMPAVCRAITHQLMSRYQESRIPRHARETCQHHGEIALLLVLDAMQDHQQSSGTSIAALLEMLRSHIMTLLDRFKDMQRQGTVLQDGALALQIIQKTLALDCYRLSLDRAAIVAQKTLQHDVTTVSGDIWTALVQSIRSANIPLASAVLQGASRTLVLEKLTAQQIQATPKYAKPWNDVVSVIQKSLVELLERMEEFSPSDLQSMFASPSTAPVIYAMLFSGEAVVQEAATSMLKGASPESCSRRDCIRFLLTKYFTTTLGAISHTLQLIAEAKVYMPTLMVIKLGTDLLESLCDSQDGLLRTKTLTKEESTTTEHAWKSLWSTISTMFEHTEAWSTMGYNKDLLIEFCRNAMDFADMAFDQYSVISGALDVSDVATDKTELDKRLLSKPNEAADHMVTWLRLRDEYLIGRAVSLTGRVMVRLTEVGLELSDAAVDFIDDIAAGTTKNKLTSMQKAELRRALDKHLPDVVDDVQVIEPKTQSSLQNWTSKSSERKTGIDFDSWKAKASEPSGPRYKVPAIERTKPIVKTEKIRPSGLLKGITGPAVTSVSDFKRKRLEEQEAKRKRDLAAIAAAKGARAAGIQGAGSGTAGIGVEGKAHNAKGQTVMVSSDEDSDDELDEELFGPSTKTSKPKAVKVDKVIQEPRGPVKLQRKQRSQKDMQARLKPDLSSLHRTILGWDLFFDGEYPPNSGDWQYQKVAASFRHVDAYRDTFQPLLTLEAWQGFVRSREECSAKPFELKIVSRSNVDAFLEISTALTMAENREVQASEGDIVFISTSGNPLTDRNAAHCLSRVHRTSRKKGVVEVIYRVIPAMAPRDLAPGATFYGIKIQSITPLEREYGALVGLQYYDLCTQIIKAQPSPLLEYSDKQITPLMSTYSLNKAQAKAIKSAVDNDAFTLIQGPPGSGKTKTIVAIVGALLGESIGSLDGITQIKAPGANKAVSGPPRKLLVCAPSNAAVDELVMRFKHGIRTMRGQDKTINVLRLGRSDAINSGVVDVTLDELVNKRLGSSNDNAARDKTQALMKQHQAVSEKLRSAREELDKAPPHQSAKLNDDMHRLRKEKNDLGTKIDNAKDAEVSSNRNHDLQRRKVQQAVLDEAHVICATLSGSGHDLFQSLNVEFETVVVDEAAQCVEMSALIPLKYGCAKCILVGDPKQLPPTVFSKEAARFQYEQSLFVRMQANFPNSVHLLDTQYRMHPDISIFPSASFYDSRLLDGPDMAALRQRPWHNSPLLSPYRFFDVEGQHSTAPKGHSLINRAEIDVALALYKRLMTDYADYDFKGKIGIITPYKSQLALLKDRFSAMHGRSILQDVDFNTTDAFQGRESEIIIFSCVRASPAGNIGFLQDIRRMNVGLTRAKSSLWVLGNGQSLMRGEYWKKLVVNAQERGLYVTGNVSKMLQQSQRGTSAKAPVAPMMTPSVPPSVGQARKGSVGKPISEVPRKTSVGSAPRREPSFGEDPKPSVSGVSRKSSIDGARPTVSAAQIKRPSVTAQPDVKHSAPDGMAGSVTRPSTASSLSEGEIVETAKTNGNHSIHKNGNINGPATSHNPVHVDTDESNVGSDRDDSSVASRSTIAANGAPRPGQPPRPIGAQPTVKKRKPATDVFMRKPKQARR